MRQGVVESVQQLAGTAPLSSENPIVAGAKGPLKIAAGGVNTLFSGASLVVPEVAAFNVGSKIVANASKGTQLEPVVNFVLAPASTIGDAYLGKPTEGSTRESAQELLDVLATVLIMKGGHKGIETIRDKFKTEGALTPAEVEQVKETLKSTPVGELQQADEIHKQQVPPTAEPTEAPEAAPATAQVPAINGIPATADVPEASVAPAIPEPAAPAAPPAVEETIPPPTDVPPERLTAGPEPIEEGPAGHKARIGNTDYTVTRSDEGLRIVNDKTGKEIDRKSSSYDPAVKSYLGSIESPTLDTEGITHEGQYYHKLAQQGVNPHEIAAAYESIEKPELNHKDAMIQQYLAPFPRENYARFGDANMLEGNKQIQTNYFNDKGKELDVQADDISDYAGVPVEPADIIDFIDRNPNGKNTAKPVEMREATALKERFKEVTGVELTPEVAEHLLKHAEKIEDIKDGIDPAVKKLIATEGITPENIHTLEGLFDGFPYDHDDLAKVKEYLNDQKRERESGRPQQSNDEPGRTGAESQNPPQEETVRPAEGADGTPGDGHSEAETAKLTEAQPEIKQSGLFKKDFLKNKILQITGKKPFTARGMLPKFVFERNILREGAENAITREIRYTGADFSRQMKADYGKNIPKDVVENIDEVLRGGGDPTKLSPDLQAIVQRMRDHVDALSRELIKAGAVTGDMIPVFDANDGMYLTRSYAKYDVPDWGKHVDLAVRNRAEAFIINEYAQKGQPLPQSELDGIIKELLWKDDAPMAILSGGKTGSKDLSILKKRSDIPPEIRALMGEYKDPMLNYARSVTKMAGLLERHKFLEDIKAEGLDKWLFDKPTRDHITQIAAKGSKTFEPLNGLYTTPDIAKAFEKSKAMTDANSNALVHGYFQALSFAKTAKTVYSATTHVRNMVSNMFIAAANGHLDPKAYAEAAKTIITDFGNLSDKALRDKYKHYLDLGVLQEGISTGELKAVLKDANPEDPFTLLTSRRTATGKLLKAAKDKSAEAYAAEDNFFKIAAFEQEKARYKKAYPNLSDAELEAKASKIVQDTYPTYARAPKILKEMRKVPIFGSFPTFSAEMIRTAYNTVKLAKDELAKPETRSIGIKRTAGIIFALTSTAAATALSRYALGISDGEDKDLRRVIPEWSANSQLIYTKNPSNGKYSYIDLGALDPYNIFKAPFMAMLQGKPIEEGVKDAIGEISSPFVNRDILAKPLFDLANNYTEAGTHVYNPEDDTSEKLKDAVMHVGETLLPGTITSLNRVRKGALNETNSQGRHYDLGNELMAMLTGIRFTEQDVNQSMSYKVKDYSAKLGDAHQMFTSEYYKKGGVTDEEKADAYRKANKHSKAIFNDFQEIMQSVRRLGVPESAIKANVARFKQGPFPMSNAEKGGMLKGRYTPVKIPIDVKNPLKDELLKIYKEYK